MKINSLFLFLVISGSFLLGWLFPIEGPVDYVYDDYKAHKVASKNCSSQVAKKDLTEEELDYIEETLKELLGQE